MCKACGAVLVRKRFPSGLEDRGRFLKRQYCNQQCMAKGFLHENPSRGALLDRAQAHKKQACEKCGSTHYLSIHHRDRDWSNNEPTNLETLCASCHAKDHHSSGDIVPKFQFKNCRQCGRGGCKRSLCETCRTRIKRRGSV